MAFSSSFVLAFIMFSSRNEVPSRDVGDDVAAGYLHLQLERNGHSGGASMYERTTIRSFPPVNGTRRLDCSSGGHRQDD
jgi:hypothetical protein